MVQVKSAEEEKSGGKSSLSASILKCVSPLNTDFPSSLLGIKVGFDILIQLVKPRPKCIPSLKRVGQK